ncbi:extracellular solute-binding protein [Mycobacterium sp. NPDC006124]|uniref:ABC transporter substrate-binding protein n=1 Tax=Mycobacterium sp. NPDC006124 TaxID=3156729 RepID=UPI0033AE210C
MGSAADEPGDLGVYTYRGFEAPELWGEYAAAYPGKTPTFQFLDSDAQAFAKVQSGLRTDIVQASVGYALDFENAKLVQPWDTSAIANFSQLDPELLKYGQIDGAQVSIPTDFGFNAPLYRNDRVEPTENSWSLIFDDRYKGQITWYDGPVDMMTITGIYQRVSDPLNMSAAELDAAKKFLIEKKKLVRNITSSPTDVQTDLQQGNIAVAAGNSYVYTALAAAGANVTYMQPKEGRLAWSDGFMLTSGSSNPRHAHDFASAWLSAPSGQYELDVLGMVSPNRKVNYGTMRPDVRSQLGLDKPGPFSPPAAFFMGHCPKRTEYGRAWDEVKAS